MVNLGQDDNQFDLLCGLLETTFFIFYLFNLQAYQTK